MGHYMVHTLICLCSYYICSTDVNTLATTSHKGNAEVVIPQRVNSAGEFVSHVLPQHYRISDLPANNGLRTTTSGSGGVDGLNRRKRRQVTTDDDAIYYLVPIGGQEHHLELRPNRQLISPGAITETHDADDGHVTLRRMRDVQCHFIGHVRNDPDSVVALSTCDGLTGFIRTKSGYFMIEPIEREAARTPAAMPTTTPASSSSAPANLTDDHHPHLVYQRHSYDPGGNSNCETRGRNETIRVKRHVHQPEEDINNMYSTKITNDLHLELLLVLDKSFLLHHKDSDVEHYLLANMNMAHKLFVQESLGRAVYLVVVRVIRLEYDDNEINLSIVKDPSRTLVNFRNWQRNINPGDDDHPNHHDLAILFTRVDIYGNDDMRSLLGLSHESGACEPKLQAVICQDTDLMLGFILAHEIGHSLGIPHDEIDESGCNSTLQNGLYTVMTPNIGPGIADWSVCSKKFLRIYLESGFGRCLTDNPSDHPFEYVDDLPGAIYDGNWQCRFRFGSGASLCDRTPRCDKIFCYVPNEGCIDAFTAPADGTFCGENKWCFRGECVQMGMRPLTRDGGWGPWSPWSSCTRTCGSGVSHSERRCDSPTPDNGGEFCKGPQKKYKICAADPCMSDEPRFRDKQCANYDTWVFPEDGKRHNWRAHMTLVDDPCALVCVNDYGTVATLADRVIDGTNCLKGIRDICLAGKCVTIPCDLNIESGAVEDVCGVCHGDGTTCTLKEGTKFFSGAILNTELSVEESLKLIDIPEGTQNIQIDVTAPSKSQIEVRDLNGTKIFVEGNELGLFEVPGSRAWLGMVRPEQQSLRILGPVALPLSIWVKPKKSITIKYSLAVKTEKRIGAYAWDYADWSDCSSQCGVGYSVAKPRCMEQSSGLVDDRYCEDPKPDKKVKTCETQICATRWFVGDWQRCINAVQNRIVRCERPVGEEVQDAEFVSQMLCRNPRPAEHKPCDNRRVKRKIQNNRRKRKVFHAQHKYQKVFLKHNPKTHVYNERRWKRGENGEIEEEKKTFAFERGLINVDKLCPETMKFIIEQDTVQNETNEEIVVQEVVRELKGRAAMKEMEKIEKCRSDTDKV